MSKAKLPREIQLKIIEEKHAQIPSIMSEHKIDCWIIFVRETEANPDPIMDLVIGGDVVWDSAFTFVNKDGDFSKIALVGNFDAPAEARKGIWDKVLSYKEGITKPLKEYLESVNPKKIALNFSEDDVVADGLSHGMFLKITSILSERKDMKLKLKILIRYLIGKNSSKAKI